MATRGPKRREPIERFMNHVEKTNTCWLWTGATVRPRQAKHVYGLFAKVSKFKACKMTTAHRFAYEHYVGPIPEGHEIDHLCKNTLCVNPEHLEAVTPQENMLRSDGMSARNSRKSHCPRGHAYAEHGYVNPNTGKRRCKTCSNAYSRAYYFGFRGDVTELPSSEIGRPKLSKRRR